LALPAMCGDMRSQLEIEGIDAQRLKFAALIETCNAALHALQKELRAQRMISSSEVR